MNEYRIIAKLCGINAKDRTINVGVSIESIGSSALLEKFNAEAYEAILKAMKDANEDAFNDAMMSFIDEELQENDKN